MSESVQVSVSVWMDVRVDGGWRDLAFALCVCMYVCVCVSVGVY